MNGEVGAPEPGERIGRGLAGSVGALALRVEVEEKARSGA